MSAAQVDHVVVAAATLQAGAAWCEATLGAAPQPGGRHALMGTHNLVMKVASETFPDTYLEIIAIDPAAPAPDRARWFGLDATDVSGGPRLIHFVARSTMLDMHRWGLINVGLAPGDPLQASRATPSGTLEWEILVRGDGTLPCAGALPSLIRWHGAHPAAALLDSGVRLTRLQIGGVPQRALDVLRLRGVAQQPDPGLVAHFDTPRGAVVLRSTTT